MSQQLLLTLARLAHHQDHKHGHLLKLGDFNRTWKKRYFVLRGSCLYYFTSPDDTFRPKGAIDLIGASVKVEDQTIQVLTAGGRQYELREIPEEGHAQWASAIQLAIAREAEIKGAMQEHLQLAQQCATLLAERELVKEAMEILNRALEDKEQTLQCANRRIEELEARIRVLSDELSQSQRSATLLREANAQLKHKLSGD
jgi:hypothetical protein